MVKLGCNILSKMQFIDLKHQYQTIQLQIDQAIQKVLNHGQYILGPEVFKLEAELASYSGTEYCVSCSSGTDALLMSLMAKKKIMPGRCSFYNSFYIYCHCRSHSIVRRHTHICGYC